MAHPDRFLGLGLKAGEQPRVTGHVEVCEAELALGCGLHLPTEEVGHQLHAVTDPEHRDAGLEDRPIEQRSAFGVDRIRSPRQDQPSDFVDFVRPWRLRIGANLAVDLGFTDPPSDQLGVLGPEVQDQDLLPVGHCPPPLRPGRRLGQKKKGRLQSRPEPPTSVPP